MKTSKILLIIFANFILFGSFGYNLDLASGDKFFAEPEDPAKWFENKGLKTDFKSIADVALNHKDWEFRTRAKEVLVDKYNDQSADIYLNMAENDPDDHNRKWAAFALAELKDKRAIGPLKRAASHPNSAMPTKEAVATYLLDLGDLSGIQYLLEGKDSLKDSDRYFSSNGMVAFFKYREKILEEYKVDIYEVFLEFGHDSHLPIRKNFLYYWPRQNVPKDLMEKFIEIAKSMMENDPDPYVKFSAELRVRYWESQNK